MASLGLELSQGMLVGDRYEIEGIIGRGGMGTVYGAVHTLTRRRVALKIVTWSCPEERGDREGRFLSEARNAVAVRHRNVVDVLDMGVHRGEPFLVMERLEGESLEDLIVRVGPLSAELTLALMLPIMGALSALHARGIVHRDIKPSNIFLAGGAGEVIVPKLLDFGLSRALTDVRMTRQGVVLGTPLYMAPEHASGLATGPQSDVWSLGVVLFECLTGALPYASTEPNVVATQVLAGHVRRISSVTSTIPPLLAAAVDRALVRELPRRHEDMPSFAAAVVEAALADGLSLPENPEPVGLPDYRAWLDGSRLPPRRPPSQPTQPLAEDAPAAAPSPSASRVTKQPRPWRRGALAAAVMLSVLALVVLRLATRQEHEVAPTPAVVLPAAPDLPRAQPNTPAPSVHALDPASHVDPNEAARAEGTPATPPTGNAKSDKKPRRRPILSVRPPAEPAPAAARSDIETEWK